MSKVLIVDDDPIHQRIVQIMIERHNIFDEFKSFMSASSAIDFLKENAAFDDKLPDVILLDLNMPIMDGWGFLDQFQFLLVQIKKAIKIYIVSSSVDEKDISRSQTYPFVTGFISKPLSPDLLRNTL